MMLGFDKARAAVEAEGVYVGGWSLKQAFTAKSGVRVEQINALIDWEPAEEAKLVRKLDLRVLLPCCIVYFLAYLDRVKCSNSNRRGVC